ncbi:MAG: non-canonical purine NTP pyrophosphatase [Patescibacteria group bacterium]|jgi:inosine/xanthosine triphosphate pyrophosphatase family protein
MKQIIFGTTNQEKINQIQAALSRLGIDVIGIGDFPDLPRVEENGTSALENAVIKARAYSQAIGEPVLSMDNALYFEGLPAEEQPGIHVRTFLSEKRLDDEAAVAKYAEFIRNHGETLNSYWEFGLCIAHPDGRILTKEIKSPRIFTSEASENRIPGYPLESLQKISVDGPILADIPAEDKAQFWQDVIGKEVREWFESMPEFASEIKAETGQKIS